MAEAPKPQAGKDEVRVTVTHGTVVLEHGAQGADLVATVGESVTVPRKSAERWAAMGVVKIER